ncbi:MAG: hypothetical protein V1858_00295 [Candidatus Gottesmanbacteria bacterium]
MKKIIVLLTFLSVFFYSTKISWAAVRCETQYGGGETCVRTGELQIDKEVLDPQNNKFVDNLFLNSNKFSAGEEITFKLKIKNVGDEKFATVQVRDYLPEFLEVLAGDFSFEIKDLDPGETVERDIKARVVADKRLADNTTLCVVNTAEAWSGDEKDKDTAQICLAKKVLGVTTQPKTGPANLLLVFFTASILSLFGLGAVLFKRN